MTECDDIKINPIEFPEDNIQNPDKQMTEVCDFMAFSVKPDSTFRGTVLLIFII